MMSCSFLNEYWEPSDVINKLENNNAETTVPVVTVSFPPSGTMTRTDILTFYGTASDAVKVEIAQNGEGWASVNGVRDWSYPVVLTEGSNTFLIKATSDNGVTNPPLEWLVILDQSSPDLTNLYGVQIMSSPFTPIIRSPITFIPMH